jgi:uncharacterized coiled-coil protein SlyX
MIQMTMGKQHCIKTLEAQTAFQDLALGTLATIQQETILPVKDYVPR